MYQTEQLNEPPSTQPLSFTITNSWLILLHLYTYSHLSSHKILRQIPLNL